jgi:hypothetical protein
MKVHELLSDPARWTKGVYARDANNRFVTANDTAACKWCVAGAIIKCYGYEEENRKLNILDGVLKKHGSEYNAISFNDATATTHEEIINLLKEAGI